MAMRYPRLLATSVDEALYARVSEAALATGLSQAEVVRRWLRQGHLSDLAAESPVPQPAALIREALRLLETALRTLDGGAP
jgi:hypothetical protein